MGNDTFIGAFTRLTFLPFYRSGRIPALASPLHFIYFSRRGCVRCAHASLVQSFLGRMGFFHYQQEPVGFIGQHRMRLVLVFSNFSDFNPFSVHISHTSTDIYERICHIVHAVERTQRQFPGTKGLV